MGSDEDGPLNAAFVREHEALHAWFVGQLLHIDPKDQHKRYEEMIEAHDAVARLWESPVRKMYKRLAAEYDKRPKVPDRRGGVDGDLSPF